MLGLEKRELRVNGSNFKFIKLRDYCILTDSILLRSEFRRSMYYKCIFFVNNKNKENNNPSDPIFKLFDISGMFGNITIPNFYKKRFNEAWVVVRESGKRISEVRYDAEDIKLLLSFAGCSRFKYINLTEKLVLASRSRKAIRTFYSSYGSEDISGFSSNLSNLIEAYFKSEDFYDSYPQIVPMYERSRYSVHSLIEDLFKSGAKIMMNEDLLGEYNRISDSPIIDYSKSNIIIDYEHWCDFVDIVGNKTRANISIKIRRPVKIINIPENKFGIDKELNVFGDKSFCIIRDGMLWQKKIAVKVNDTLRKKLGRYKDLISAELLDKNELVLNLTKLPVETKSQMHCLSLGELSKVALREKLAGVALEYLSMFYPEADGSKVIDEKGAFLYTLGVDSDGSFLFNDTTVTKIAESVVEETYMANQIQCSISGLGTLKKRGYSYTSFYNNGYCDNKIIDEFLNANHFKKITNNIIAKEAWRYWTDQKIKNSKKLRKYIFGLIMNKNLKFDQKDKSGINQLFSRNIMTTINDVYKVTTKVNINWIIGWNTIQTKRRKF